METTPSELASAYAFATIGSHRARGRRLGDVVAYRGIPYALDPIRGRRFESPRPVRGFGGRDVDATMVSPAVPQPPSRMAALMGEPSGSYDEAGSLTLNVWAPVNATGRPVLFWLHGGALLSGSASWPWYDGRRLAQTQDIVVVTANYRLGALGYLDVSSLDRAAGTPEAQANFGLLDQACALEWVSQNIEAFGGDPDNVTVGGQSSGAESAALLAGATRTAPLVKGLSLQSGGAHGVVQSPEQAASVSEEFLRILEPDPKQPVTLETLRRTSLDDLLAAQTQLLTKRAQRGETNPPFNVVAQDGVPSGGSASFLASRRDLVILAGWTRDELVGMSRLAAPPTLSRTDAVGRLSTQFGARAGAILEYYEARHLTTSSMSDAVAAITGDAVMMRPVLDLAEARAGHGASTYLYRFDWAAPTFGACHCVDLPFTFGTFEDWSEAPMVAGSDMDEMRSVAAHFMNALGGFVRDGRPSPSSPATWNEWSRDESVALIGGAQVVITPHLGIAERELLG